MTTIATRRALAFVLAAAAVALSACGKDATPNPLKNPPRIGIKGNFPKAAQGLGFPAVATKNTTRVGGGDATATAAGVALAVYPGVSADSRPRSVVLADSADWRGALAASVLMAPPLRAPLLYATKAAVPPATASALKALAPSGAQLAGNAQVIRIGAPATPRGLRTTTVAGTTPAALAAAIDRLQSSAAGHESDVVVVVSSDDPSSAMPAAAWAAKSGNPILYAGRDALPAATRRALDQHQKPRIYVLGGKAAVSSRVEKQLRKYGTVKRIDGGSPVETALTFARYADTDFGWDVRDPGHGVVFARVGRPLDAAAAAPLSASGTYGPLLLLDSATTLAKPVEGYLLDIEPGFDKDPVRGVYNHGWLIGDSKAISVAVQARIDSLLEIAPVSAPKQ